MQRVVGDKHSYLLIFVRDEEKSFFNSETRPPYKKTEKSKDKFFNVTKINAQSFS
jgi:hypothetical protein